MIKNPAVSVHSVGFGSYESFHGISISQAQSSLSSNVDRAYQAFLETRTPHLDWALPTRIVDEKRFAGSPCLHSD